MSIYDKLFDYQKNIVDTYKSRKSFGVFLDMGLGKTPICLALSEINNCTKTIVISINSKAGEDVELNGSWLNWASKSSIGYDNLYNKNDLVKLVKKAKKTNAPLFINNNKDIILLNYEWLYEKQSDNSTSTSTSKKSKKSKYTVRACLKEFIKSATNQNIAIILDESHKVKSSNSVITETATTLINIAKIYCKNVYLYLATGTPFTRDLIDIYSQLKLLGWNQTKQTFKDKFCVLSQIPTLLPWQQYPVAYKNVDLLYQLIHHFAITMKTELAIPLPEKTFVYYTLPESNIFKLITRKKLSGKEIGAEFKRRGITDLSEYGIDINCYNTTKLVNNPFYCNLDFPSDLWYADTTIKANLRTRQATIGFQGNSDSFIWYDRSRLDQLEEFLTVNEDNYILFYSYVPELVEIYDICQKLDYNIDVWCGEIKSLTYYNKYSNQSDGERLSNKKNIIIGNWSSMSTGLNLQSYNKCIVFDLPSFGDWQQGIKRINRVGQNNTCIYYLFTQDNTIEKHIKQCLDNNTEYDNNLFMSDLNAINLIKNN